MSWLPATALLDPSHPTGLQHKFTFPGQVLPHIDNYYEAIFTDSTPELTQSSSCNVGQDICPNSINFFKGLITPKRLENQSSLTKYM